MITRTFPLLALALAVFGCKSTGEEIPPDETFSVSLDADIRDHADVAIVRRGLTTSVDLTITNGWGVLPAGTKLAGRGRVERFPEADMTLYTARFSLEPIAAGPCGDKPISLALSLHHRGDGDRYSGSLTPYCGKDVWAGIPARSPLRLATPPPEL